MSGPHVRPISAYAYLTCDRCGFRYRSSPFQYTNRWGQEIDELRPAFVQGWRVYASGHGQRTYCPGCEPTVPMHLVYPKARD